MPPLAHRWLGGVPAQDAEAAEFPFQRVTGHGQVRVRGHEVAHRGGYGCQIPVDDTAGEAVVPRNRTVQVVITRAARRSAGRAATPPRRRAPAPGSGKRRRSDPGRARSRKTWLVATRPDTAARAALSAPRLRRPRQTAQPPLPASSVGRRDGPATAPRPTPRRARRGRRRAAATAESRRNEAVFLVRRHGVGHQHQGNQSEQQPVASR